jgi:hypothetical protein
MALKVLSFDVGTKNLAACELQVDPSGTFSVSSWTVESCVARGLNVNKTPVHELAPTFYAFVKKRVTKWFYNDDKTTKNISRVFIENQPLGGRGAARNLKTKILSHILQCVIVEAVPDVPVYFVHPSLKLKDMPREDGVRPTYRQNKLYAISKTTELVESAACQNKDVCTDLFISKKMKKDDLADAFLQGLYAGLMHARNDVIEPVSDDKPKRSAKKKSEAVKGAVPAAAAPDVAVEPAPVGPEPAEEVPKGASKAAKKKRSPRDVVADEALAVPAAVDADVVSSPKKKAKTAKTA